MISLSAASAAGAHKPTALLLLLLVAGCAAPESRGPATARPQPYTTRGLENVMGQSAAKLLAEFGTASLDIQEGTARKLQFASSICVLDAYLYPPTGGGEPRVTHVDARLPDGRDIDRSSSVAALMRRGR